MSYHRLEMQPANSLHIVVIIATTAFAVGVVSARAEQMDPKRLNTMPQPQPKLVIRTEDLFALKPPPRLGTFTLVSPQTNGEVVRVSIPVGELVSRAARAVSDANHRRAERKADERVRQDLERYIAAANGQNVPAP